MKKADQDFYDYVVTESLDPDFTQKINEMYSAFISGISCPACGGKNIKIIIDPKVVIWCNSCREYRDNISLDRIEDIDYSTVEMLHESKIIDILKRSEKI